MSARRRFTIPATLAICAAASGIPAAPAAGQGGVPEPEEALDLFVSLRLVAYKRATVRAEGFAESPLELWVYEDLRGNGCSATPAGRPPRTRIVFGEVPVDGGFGVARSLRMKKPGQHTFCAYLGPDEGTASNTVAVGRRVQRPLLPAARARRTVAAAIRRHGFADRVVANLDESCRRRSRSKFECRLSSAFPGYSLNGGGSVELKRRLSYRFQVSVRGRSFVLTDENEGSAPG